MTLWNKARIAVLILASTGSEARADIIDSTFGIGAGGFELGTFISGGAGENNFQSLLAASTGPTGWTIGGVGVDWLSTPFYGAKSGIHAIDLGYIADGAGSVSTTIPTSVGASYTLSFSAAAVTGFSNYTNAGHVSAGSLASQAFAPAFTPTPLDFTNQGFTDYSFTFTALAATTAITFSADAPHTGYGPIIDNVSVNIVPEPTTGLLICGSFLVIARVRRRGFGFAARR